MEARIEAAAGGARRLTLAGELVIYHAHALQAALVEALDGAVALEVDLAQVSDIDSAGMQLLVAAKRQAGAAVRLTGHSPAVIGLMETYDLAGWFGDALVLPGSAATGRRG